LRDEGCVQCANGIHFERWTFGWVVDGCGSGSYAAQVASVMPAAQEIVAQGGTTLTAKE